MSRYIRPKLNGNEVLYKGRRFWAFRVSDATPFEGNEDFGSIVVWDGIYGIVVAVVNDQLVGSVGYWTIQQSYDINCKDMRDLIAQTKVGLDVLDR